MKSINTKSKINILFVLLTAFCFISCSSNNVSDEETKKEIEQVELETQKLDEVQKDIENTSDELDEILNEIEEEEEEE